MTVSGTFYRGETLTASDLNTALAEHIVRTGDTMQGLLRLAQDPVNAFDAATKQYVDRFTAMGVPTGAYIGAVPPGNVLAPLWWDTNSGQLYIQYNDGSSTQWVAANSLGDPANAISPRDVNVFNVQDYGAKGDGTTDDTAAIQAAINAAAGHGALRFPATQASGAPAVYRIGGTGLHIPSNSHLIIEAGACLMLIDNAPQMNLITVGHASNVIIELYGTLDGNRLNQPGTLGTSDGNGVNGGIGGGACHNILIVGGNQGTIKNFKNWSTNIGGGNNKGEICTNVEIRGLSITDCGNSAGFAGITVRCNVVAGSTYTASSGDIKFVTDVPHGILVGETFSYFGAGNPSQYLQGEYVALSVPNANEVHGHVAVPTVGGGAITTGKIGYCNRCYNVGVVDCYIARIPDLAVGLYSGCNGSYIRGCEITQCGSTGPFIFADSGQPASCVDCEISDCWVHDTYGSGVGVISNQYGIYHKNSRVFNNTVTNCRLGGISINFNDGVEVFGNSVHNSSTFNAQARQTGLITIATTALKANVWGNTLRDPNPALLSTTQTRGQLLSYNTSTGAISLQTSTAGTGGGSAPTPVPHNILPGDTFAAHLAVGTGDCLKLEGAWVATAGTGGGTNGSTLNFTAPTGLVFTLNRINFFQTTYATATTHVVPGTYASDANGIISLQTDAPHNYPVGAWFVLDSIIGSTPPTGGATDFAGTILNGQQLAIAGTTGTTLTFTVTPGVTIVVTNNGRVLPACFGIVIAGTEDPGDSLTNTGTGPDYAKISGNRIGDYQSPQNMVACTGGVWGLNGAADGNYFGPRRGADPDVSNYNKSGINGINYDLVNNVAVVSMDLIGLMTFRTNAGGSFQYLPPQGLTPTWNYSSGRGEVDFFCGEGGGAPGGFNFYQVQTIQVAPTGSTYDPVTGIVTLITRIAHTVNSGSVFALKNVLGTDTTHTGTGDVLRLAGSHVANSDSTGTTLTFNAPLNLTILTITGGQVVPAHTGGGLVKTSVGLNGSLLANDGYGNTQLGGALVHGKMQTVASLANAGTVTVNQHTSMVLIRNSASIAAATIVMPATAASQYATGAEMELNFQNPVGALTWSGATVVNPPTAIAVAGASANFVNSGSIWLRRIAI